MLGGSLLDTPIARAALERGGHLRVGIEDWDDGPANVEQVAAAGRAVRRSRPTGRDHPPRPSELLAPNVDGSAHIRCLASRRFVRGSSRMSAVSGRGRLMKRRTSARITARALVGVEEPVVEVVAGAEVELGDAVDRAPPGVYARRTTFCV